MLRLDVYFGDDDMFVASGITNMNIDTSVSSETFPCVHHTCEVYSIHVTKNMVFLSSEEVLADSLVFLTGGDGLDDPRLSTVRGCPNPGERAQEIPQAGICRDVVISTSG